VLSTLLAQQIAGETTEAIGYNVIITDDAGVVIGSGDVSRVGTFHEASVDVMRTREPAWHDPEQARALQGVRPGITLPLLIGDQAVGTVGITGSPRQVRRFGILVRRQTEILLQESEVLRSRLLRERALERLVAEVAEFDPDVIDRDVLRDAAAGLGYEIPHPRRVLLIDFGAATIGPELLRAVRATFHHPQDMVATRSATRCAVLADLGSRDDARVDELAGHLLDQVADPPGAVLGVSDAASTLEELRDACSDAESALRLGARFRPGDQVLRIRDLRLPQALEAVPRLGRSRLMQGALGSLVQDSRPELSETVVAWCESGFNLVAAAGSLHVHRNTLIYRLDRIEELLGRPWRDHRAMLTAYVAVLAGRLENA
jgi:carbohydrate diacid regulator